MAESLYLLRHDGTNDYEWTVAVAEGHPPIPAVLPELRAEVSGGDREVTWHHRGVHPWGAVMTLHRSNRHAEATALAQLLVWCEAHGSPRTADPIVWEIRDPDAKATDHDQTGGEPPMIVTHELQVCMVCLHLLANGEYNDGTDAAARCAQGLVERWGELAGQIVLGLAEPCGCSPEADCRCGDLGYHTSRCEGCGDPGHGDRFAAVILEPEGGAG